MAKTKALISCAVTSQLICVFVFAYAKAGFLMTWLIWNYFIGQSMIVSPRNASTLADNVDHDQIARGAYGSGPDCWPRFHLILTELKKV